ncbi:heme ABC transporter ATP-binding protein [Salmonella enterica subsp. enterica serovar Rubislaw]|nr:heme ABC transporter ATP-binding protein [Salmonella enterica]EBL5124169.1 heme ABC transporter ATP-binding protein [Salmonella enterica subsp. enterica serovar Rubislaw]EDV3151533.1 heme ABC transporter ATP-binding protein [Salmonella enterica subsp. enterica serovar Chandans]
MAEQLIAGHIRYTVSGKTLIHDVSLTLSPGELVTLIGPNGAGKSTLLRLLTGYLPPADGRCILAGKALTQWPAQALSRRRAVMLQHTQMGFDWPTEAVIGMGRMPWTPHPEPSVIQQVMQLTGCLSLAGRYYADLSGGERQRIQFARALAQLWDQDAPRGWLFLDEPTSAQDLFHQQHLLRLLKSLTRQGHLHVCIVLHDLNLAALWADRIILLHGGAIVAQGSPDTVLQTRTLSRWYGADVQVGVHPQTDTPQVFLAP